MITLPTSYSNSLKRPHKENWLFRLYNNTGSYIGLALDDVTDDAGDFYRGVITNRPSLREKINLHSSTSSVSNISITIANFNYNNNDFSKELVFGTNYYINQDVKIYSRVNDSVGAIFSQIDEEFDSYDITFQNASDDKLLIYTGRLESVSHNHNTITLNIVAKRPWDDISIPNTKTTNNIDIPVSYGNFATNSNTTYSSPSFLSALTEQNYRPILAESTEDGKLYFASSSESKSDAELAIYDRNMDKFIPCELMIDDSQATTVSKNSAYLSYAHPNLKRGFKYRGTSAENSDNTGFPSPPEWTNTGNAIDTSTSSTADITDTKNGAYNTLYESDYLLIKFPHPTGNFVSGNYKIDITYDFDANTDVTIVTGTIRHRVYILMDNSQTTSQAFDITSSTATIDQNNQTLSITGLTSVPENAKIYVEVSFVSGGAIQAGNSLTWNLNVKDVAITGQFKDDPKNISEAYTGADGLDRSYSSGNTTKIHEAVRDILHRYTSLTLTTDPTGWSALDTARSSWTIRYWLNEPELLKDVLDQLSYEGAFIYRMRQDDTLQFIHVPNNPSNDHTVTKDDISNFKISHTPFSDLITKTEYEYERHPAENRYISTATVTNSTSRTNYNIGTEDNVKKIELEALVAAVSGGTGMNASHGNYYNELNGEVRIVMSCDVVNPQIAASMEVGDIVYMSDMPVSAFGTAFPEQFILTSLKKSPGRTSIELFQTSDTSAKGGPT